jgi:hypothetical protein
MDKLHLVAGGAFGFYSLLPCVAVTILHFIAAKVLGVAIPSIPRVFTTCRQGPLISVSWMQMVIDMAVDVRRAMKPWASADEDAAVKPFWAVISVRRAAIGRQVVIPVRANRWRPYIDAYLSLCSR